MREGWWGWPGGRGPTLDDPISATNVLVYDLPLGAQPHCRWLNLTKCAAVCPPAF